MIRTKIVIFLAFVGLVFFLRCDIHEPSGDELLYQYVWEADDSTNLWNHAHRFERKVCSAADIARTQIIHFQIANGRIVPHAVEQSFTGREQAFSIVNTLVFLLFVWLIVRFCSGRWLCADFYLWAVVTMSLLILFPLQGSLWTSINYGPNYLWSATLAMVVLLLWQCLSAAGQKPWWLCAVAALTALVAGFSHEGFMVGIAGAMFVYYCLNIKQLRGRVLWLTVPLWIATAEMVLAPGNLSRFFGQAGNSMGLLYVVCRGLYHLVHLWVFDAMVLGAIILVVRGRAKELLSFMHRHVKLLLTLIITILFTLMANTDIHSHTFVELVSLLLVLLFARRCGWGRKKWLRVAVSVAVAAFVIQQVILIRDTRRNYHLQHAMVEMYRASADGVTVLDQPDIAPTSMPYIRIFEYNEALGQVYGNAMNSVYSHGRKQPIFVKPAEYDAITSPEKFFVAANKFPGNAPVYKAAEGHYLWIEPGVNPDSVAFVASLRPIQITEPALWLGVKCGLRSGICADNETEVEVRRFATAHGNRYCLVPPKHREVLAVDVRKKSVSL